MKIAIAGIGYVGLANAILLSQNHEVICFDINRTKVSLINKKISPVEDSEIEKFLSEQNLNISATTFSDEAYKNADYVIISTPTNYDEVTNQFNTESEKPLQGIVKYSDGTVEVGDLVGYRPSSEYEFVVDGERLFRVLSNFITIKYEHQGNEEEYNPSWAQSS